MTSPAKGDPMKNTIILSLSMISATLLFSIPAQAGLFDFGRESYKECSYLPLKSNYKEGYRPYYDKKKDFCVIPVETDATRTQVFEDSFAVYWKKYFSTYTDHLEKIKAEEESLKSMQDKVVEYQNYFQEVQKYLSQFRNAPAYARPVLDLREPTAQYQTLMNEVATKTQELQELIEMAIDKNPIKGKSILHHRGHDYAYFWHRGRKKFAAILPVPHGQKLKDVKKKFKNTSLFNALSDLGSGFVDIANDVSPAMNTMKEEMTNMAADMRAMQEDMEVMAQSMPSMAQNFDVMTQYMGQMTQTVQEMNMTVGRMSSSVGQMGNQMSKPFMGMFSFMPFM